MIEQKSLITVRDGTAEYQAVCRMRKPFRVVVGPVTGREKTWTHHMRVRRALKEFL